MNSYEHVFFDLDRTLWDFDTNSQTALRAIFTDLDLPGRGVEDYTEFVKTYEAINDKLWGYYRIGSMSKQDLRKKRFTLTLKEFGVLDEALGKRMDAAYLDVSPYQTNLIPDTLDTLEYLAGRYKLHIITNGFEEVQQVKMKRSGLEPFFDVVLTSERAKARKPDSLVFNLAFKLAKAQAENSIMIGDDLRTDILGARNVSMDQVYLNTKAKSHQDDVTHEINGLKELKLIL